MYSRLSKTKTKNTKKYKKTWLWNRGQCSRFKALSILSLAAHVQFKSGVGPCDPVPPLPSPQCSPFLPHFCSCLEQAVKAAHVQFKSGVGPCDPVPPPPLPPSHSAHPSCRISVHALNRLSRRWSTGAPSSPHSANPFCRISVPALNRLSRRWSAGAPPPPPPLLPPQC